MYKNFEDWEPYDGFSEGSGTSDQQWIVNKSTNKIGLFKFPKSEETTDHISEKIASDIAKLIGLECADIDLGIYKGRKGLISYRINSKDENLIEGIWLISKRYKSYNSNSLLDSQTNECYSLNMIMNSLKEYNLEKCILDIAIFDFLIGNSDRHDKNWAILKKDTNVKMCPLYDNASSLCSYSNEKNIEDCFNDPNKFRALVDSKSRSLIRIDMYTLGKKGPKHSEVLKYIKDNYYDDTIEFIRNISRILSEKNIEDLVNNYIFCLSNNKIKLLKKYLNAKINLLKHIYDIKD